MNTKTKYSINKKILSYLVLFALGILVVLWLTQILFLKVFYEKYQEDKLVSIAKELYNTKESEIQSKIDSLTCMEYINPINTTYYNTRINGCMLGKNDSLDKYINELINKNEDLTSVKLTNPFNKSESLLYGVRVGNSRIFLYTPLEDVDSTTSVLRSQLIYIFIVILGVAILI